MQYILVVLAAYVLGSSSMAFYLAKLKNVDIRKNGTGNLGASNTTVLLGWWSGILVLIHDVGKGILAVWLSQKLFPELPYIGYAAGVACALGHIFPFYLGFRGGKGFAAYFGMTLALNWKIGLMVALVAVIVTVVTDYIALAATATVLWVPAWFGYAEQSLAPAAILLVLTAVMLFKHKENYRRMLRHEEIGLRSTIKGKNRVK